VRLTSFERRWTVTFRRLWLLGLLALKGGRRVEEGVTAAADTMGEAGLY
jgi:hypothetical protein